MGGQVANINAPGMDQVLEGLHVAIFRPAYIGWWVIPPFLLVLRIITTGAIRARHANLQFFFIEMRFSIKASRHIADHHHGASFAAAGTGEIDRVQ